MKNIGLVGLGFMGKTHLEAYQQVENCQVTAICTSKEVNDPEITNVFNGSFITEYDDLLTNKEIDIIDICLPTYLHEEFIIQAANAGKHIICEKPLSLTSESVMRIMKAVKQSGVNLFVGHLLRFWPEYQMIKAYSESDKLKDIEIVHAKRLSQVPKWSAWFQHPEKSGGALFDLHLHDIDFVLYLLGEVESVYAVGNKNRYGAWDHVMTTLRFKNGSKAFVEGSQRMPIGFPFTMSLRAQTSQSAIDFEVVAGENIENIDDSDHQFIYYANQKKYSIEVNESDAFQNELAYFVHCIENNQDNSVVPLDDVLYTIKVLEAIESSLETRREVLLDG